MKEAARRAKLPESVRLPVLGLLALIPLALSLVLGAPRALWPAPPTAPNAPAGSLVQPAAQVPALLAQGVEYEPPPLLQPGAADSEAAPEEDVPPQPAPQTAGKPPAILKPVLDLAAKVLPGHSQPAKPAGPVVSAPYTPLLSLLHPPRLVKQQGGPADITAERIVNNAEALLGVP
ncbi:MAG TPA: hypothetical protein VF157_11100 [Chloroflexota bacterium]